MKKDEIKDYYNSKYHRRILARPISFYENILDLLKAKRGKILDIGCGAGYLLKAAEKRELTADGIDISEKAIAFAKKITKRSTIKIGDAENLPYSSNSFDYIICLGSLEHFLNIKQAVREMVRVAKNTAKFCIVVPNSNFLLWKFRKHKGTEQIQEAVLSLDEWRQILLSNGLKIMDIEKDKGPIASENKLKNFIFKILAPWLPLTITYQFIFICKKDEKP